LENYATSHPTALEARFLLAYHYLTCGYSDAAAGELREIVKRNPKDQLAAQLLGSISTPDMPDYPPATPPAAAPAQPLQVASLVGNWTATRGDGVAIQLTLGSDKTFTWTLDPSGKPQQFSGTYTFADNLLVLKQGTNPVMVGQVTPLAADRFNFKLAGDNPNDPGLSFSR
jgi:hypothetical protein